MKAFLSLESKILFRSPLTALGSPRRGCAAVCRMSRHEGELINRSTAPGSVATLPEQLAPKLAVLTAYSSQTGGCCVFRRLFSGLSQHTYIYCQQL